MKNYLGVCSLKVTRPDGKCFKISVFNPVRDRVLIGDKVLLKMVLISLLESLVCRAPTCRANIINNYKLVKAKPTSRVFFK